MAAHWMVNNFVTLLRGSGGHKDDLHLAKIKNRSVGVREVLVKLCMKELPPRDGVACKWVVCGQHHYRVQLSPQKG